ncbi:MAG: glycosyltransferase [Ferruginibacter sp.]|nr:glycosyltransferase [Ferruginibacter sp.]
MRKVLFILNDLGGGGAERVFVNIANGFAADNIPVAFLVGKKRGAYLNILNASIPVAEAGGTSFYQYLRIFPAIFKKNQYTHIFTASDYVSAAAILTKKISGITSKIYVTHHYNLPAKRPLKYWKGDLIAKLIHFFITPRADKIITVSKGSLAWLRKFSNNKLMQSVTIYNPVFDESIYKLAEEKINFPIDVTGKIILVSAGRLEEQKDQLTLIKAFSILKKTHPGIILFILGIGPLQAQLELYIDKNNLQENVFLMGFDTNPYKWMANCDVFVMSSISEGFGNVLVEAMALGKTVVSTNCPSGPGEILNQGEYGYLCPVRDPVELSKAIARAVAFPLDKELVKESSQQYMIREIVKKYIAIL